jgi:hypothetical protein
MKVQHSAVIAALCAFLCTVHAGTQVYRFDTDSAGNVPGGFVVKSGSWTIQEADSNYEGGNVLAQRGADKYNLILLEKGTYKDFDASIRVKAVSGTIDRGGGLVWRAKDENNYYVSRFNPLETDVDFRVMKAGKRTELINKTGLGSDTNWHTLRVKMEGDTVSIFFDGEKVIEYKEDTYPDAGMIGIWSKADARSLFDSLTITDLEEE